MYLSSLQQELPACAGNRFRGPDGPVLPSLVNDVIGNDSVSGRTWGS
jgi:hypothetical protein